MKRLITTCLLVALGPSWALAADAAKPAAKPEPVDPMHEAVARELLRQATTNTQRAKILFEAAEGVGDDNKKMRAYLNERALTYALESIHVDSNRHVAEYAISRLRNDAPERREHWDKMRTEMYRRSYHSPQNEAKKYAAGHSFARHLLYYGSYRERERKYDTALEMYKEALGVFKAQGMPGQNELAIMLARTARRAEAHARLIELKKQYEANSKDPVLRKKLALMWIIDLNYPSRAMGYISSSKNRPWYDCAHYASHSLSSVKEAAQAKQVGDWYHKEIVPLASEATKRDILLRAKTYYEHALALRKSSQGRLSPTARAEVAQALAKLSTELAGGEVYTWTTIFRSADPAVWNTDRSTGTLSYALPLAKVGGPIRYLKMTRLDTGQYVIVRLNAMQLAQTVSTTETHGWHGAKERLSSGGYRFGVYSRGPRRTSQRVEVTYSHWGWGFGYDRTTRKMAWTWAGRAIAKTSFQIAVTNGDLTAAEKKCLLP
ncbi:MAG: hypothetical protein ISS78_12200 [Phycisphaerae bacterium]|nr:hypothetical protein [Phycisphaerae bacterium]